MVLHVMPADHRLACIRWEGFEPDLHAVCTIENGLLWMVKGINTAM